MGKERQPIARYYLDAELIEELQEAGVFSEQQMSAICLIILRVLYKVESSSSALNQGRAR